ncbi:MAG: CBS domain-containing protein [Longimicrobiales bacterium]|nr:CBS domain-containing protein [Longimicrobiales bacterium]
MANFEIPARDYMSSPLRSVHIGDSLEDVYRRLQESGFSALPVVDDAGRVVGVLSRTDLLRLGTRQAGNRPGASLLVLPERAAEDEMTSYPTTVDAETPLSRIAEIMIDDRVHRVFVEEGDETVGVVTTRDLMRAISDKKVNHPLSRYMSSPVFTIRASEPVSLAAERLGKAKVTGLVVVEGKWPVGLFGQTEALEARDVRRETAVEDVMNPAILILDSETPIHRAAAQAASMEARRIVATDGPDTVGIVTGLDFARVME